MTISMSYRFIIVLFGAYLAWGCQSDPGIPDAQIPFDREQWKTKAGASYAYREQMVYAVLYSDTLRSLRREELLLRLGKPDREQEGHLYYTVAENRLGFWTLTQKSIVIKLKADETVEWIKLHK